MAGRRVLLYPSLGDSPTVFVNIINSKTGRPHMFQMLVDTGASRTCLPANRAAFLGHDNTHHGVKKTTVRGVGGDSDAFVHTLRLELIDPEGKIWSKLVPPWRSKVIPVHFVEKMQTQAGILGRDVLSLWQHVGFKPTPRRSHSKWTVEITL